MNLSTLNNIRLVWIEELNESQNLTHLVRFPSNILMETLGSFTCGPTVCSNGRWGIKGIEDVVIRDVKAVGSRDDGSVPCPDDVTTVKATNVVDGRLSGFNTVVVIGRLRECNVAINDDTIGRGRQPQW